MNGIIFNGMIDNAALLVCLVILFSEFKFYQLERSIFVKILTGVFIGLIGLLLMLTPWIYVKGIIFDTRSILLSLTGLFFGVIPAIISATFTALLRIYQGGDGAVMGVFVILTSASIGLFWRRYLKAKKRSPRWYELYLFGIIVHLVMLGCTIFLPRPIASDVLNKISIHVLAIYPLGTILLGLMLNRQQKNGETEMALKKSEKTHRAILQTASDGFWQTDLHGHLMEVNEAYCRMSGYSKEELLTMNISDLEVDEAKEETLAHIQLVKNTGRSCFESRHRRKDGLIFEIEASAQYHEEDGGRCVVFMHDITNRKRTEKELLKSEEQYRLIAENTADAIAVLDLNLCYTYLSPSIYKLLGYTSEEMMARKPSDFMEVDSWRNIQEAFMEEMEMERSGSADINRNRRFTFQQYRQDGLKIWVEITVSFIRDKFGHPKNILAISRDISARKQVEMDLLLAKEKAEESDRLKSAFLANMSHEIRTPMNGILGFAELLKEPDLTGEEQQEYIKIIEKSGARMLNIINDIVSISKIESGVMETRWTETNVNRQIEYVYSLLNPEAESKNLALSYHIALSDKEALVITDDDKLNGILLNLVKNAIKYTDNGSIEFGYRMVEKIHEFSLLEFYVKDTGIGIPIEKQEVIFERFIQADIHDKMARQGAGLGLAITKSYVEMLGGEIRVESEEGKGSRFYFTLPYQSQPSKDLLIASAPNPEVGSFKFPAELRLKILIAEDDETSEMYLSILTKEISSAVLQAANGLEAIELCRNHPDIDLILMDINMPEMGGYEATRQIRQFNKTVVIIAQTAYGLTGDREKSIQAGCNDYIAKPIKPGEMQSIIRKYFKTKG